MIIATAIQGLKDFGLINDLQLVAMTISTFVVIFVPLLKVAWAGVLKTSLDLVGAAVVIVIPFISLWLTGAPVTKDAIVLMCIAFIKAVATEVGVQIRTDWGAATPKALIDARESNVVTSAEPTVQRDDSVAEKVAIASS